MEGLVTRNAHALYESPITSGKKVMAKVNVFQKYVNRRSRSQGQTLWYHVQGLVTRNTHVYAGRYQPYISVLKSSTLLYMYIFSPVQNRIQNLTICTLFTLYMFFLYTSTQLLLYTFVHVHILSTLQLNKSYTLFTCTFFMYTSTVLFGYLLQTALYPHFLNLERSW